MSLFIHILSSIWGVVYRWGRNLSLWFIYVCLCIHIEDVWQYVVIVVSSKCVSLYIFCYPYELFYIGGIVICLCDLCMGLCIHTEDVRKHFFTVVSSKWVSFYIFCHPYEVLHTGRIVICFCDSYMCLCIHTGCRKKCFLLCHLNGSLYMYSVIYMGRCLLQVGT